MCEQYLRTGQRSGRRGLWFALAGIVIAAGAVAILAIGPGGGEARAQQENLTFDEALDRVEEARARIESVSYRFVRSTQRYDEAPHRHMHKTIEVLERADQRRSRWQQEQVVRGDPDHVREIHGAAVLNDHALGIRSGPEIFEPFEMHVGGRLVVVEPRARTAVWGRDYIDAANPATIDPENPVWLRMDSFNGDMLRYGFGTVHGVVSAFRPLTGPGSFRVRVFQRDGREQIELTSGDDDFGTSMLIEPERGHMITRIHNHIRGVVTLDYRVEPMLMEDESGEAIWFPRSAEVTSWLLDEDDSRSLQSHEVIRFEDVRINLPVPDEAFSLPVALEWDEGHPVQVWHEEQPGERANYRGGELMNIRPPTHASSGTEG